MSMRSSYIRVNALSWGNLMMEGTLFLMQECLRDIWKMSFTRAASFLNIWAGTWRIMSIFFLFLADTYLGNFRTLALSGIFSTSGLVLITTTTMPVYRCNRKGVTEDCVGRKEKVLFIMGMSLIALGKAACFASTIPFLNYQDRSFEEGDNISRSSILDILGIIFMSITSAIGIFLFPYIKKWYIVFGVSTICMAYATLMYLGGCCQYLKAPPKGSPLTVAFRVFVAATLKISRPVPKDDNATHLHVIADEEIQSFSPTSVLRFLHKAAIILPSDTAANGEVKMLSWKVCSVSEVEFTKSLIRMVPMWSTFVMSGVVSSIGDTYFVEQATHMNTNIGHWKAPIQFLQLIFILCKAGLERATLYFGDGGMISSIVCCTVAAAVERQRLHLVRKHHLMDQPDDAKVPMSAFLLIFQVALLGCLDGFSKYARRAFHVEEAPESLRSYGRCISEGISGLGFICGALSVYVVGKISEMGGGTNWFQDTLNKSRLDHYYWVLATLSTLNLIVFLLVSCRKRITAINNLRNF